MIESELDRLKKEGRILLSPNRSGDWPTTRIFLWLVSLMSLVIATGFSLAGAWMILPFAGIEIIALVSLVVWVTHQSRRQQVIYFNAHQVRVEKGIYGPEQSWESDLFWARLVIDKPPYRDGQPLRVILRSQQKQQLEIGEFLNEEDKKKLVSELRAMITGE